MTEIEMYTDGACKGNGKIDAVGGWAYIIKKEEKEWTDKGVQKNTTNNRMELTALLKGLEFFNSNFPGDDLILYSDSAYIINCFNQKWYIKWEKNGWIASKHVVKNKDLWIPIIREYNKIKNIKYIHVKGHAGHKMNERVDKLANGAIDLLLFFK